MQNIPPRSSQVNDDYDEAAERLRLHLKDETYRLAVAEIVKLSPKAVRYLQSVQEFSWLDDEEAALLCAKRFVEIARLIAQNVKVLTAREG
jgi:hypothetical protein